MTRLLVGGVKAAVVIAWMVIGVQAQTQRKVAQAPEPTVTGALPRKPGGASRLDQGGLMRLVVGTGGAPALTVKP